MKICKNCGNQINDGETFCPKCGNAIPVHKQNEKVKFLPSFILGLIASIFGIGGGFCTSMCTSLVRMGGAPLILIFGGSIIGLIGACQCLNNVKIGSVVELIAAVMMIICLYFITGGDMMSIMSMLLFLIGGVIGLIYAFLIKKG